MKNNKWLLLMGTLLVTCLVFGGGFFLGRWSGRANLPGAGLLQRGFLFSGSHGATGTVQAIQEKQLTLQLRDGAMQVILIDNNPRVEKNMKKASLSDIQLDNRLLVVGAPDAQGQIKARLIRILEPRVSTPEPDKNKTRTR